MNANKVFDTILNDILDVVRPLQDDWVKRFSVIRELEEIVQSVESLRGATVEPFGSFVSNLFSRWGDLDICILLTTNGTYISSAGKKRKVSLLEDLLKALRQKGGLRRLQFVPNARVPILKLESSQGISCDISIDNIQGQMKSKFLFWINEIDGRFRDMVLLVKEWAKAQKINNSKGGTLNSYSLSLMVILHFQTCMPAILPPLKEIYPANVADDLTGVRADVEQRIEEICRQNITKFRSNKSRKVNRSSLSKLFVSFLAKFADLDVKAKEFGICPFTGQWEEIDNNMRWMPHTYTIFIEDPFEQRENTARGVSAGNLGKISEAFCMSHQILVSGNLNQFSLLGMLVRPQIACLVAGIPTGNPNYTTHYSQSSGTYSSRPRQKRLQDSEDRNNSSTGQKREVHPNNSMQQKLDGRVNISNKQRPMQRHNSSNQLQKRNSSNQKSGHQQNSNKQGPKQEEKNQPKQIWRPKTNKSIASTIQNSSDHFENGVLGENA